MYQIRGFHAWPAALLATLLLALPAGAATPASGTLSTTSATVSYTSGPFAVSNSSAQVSGLGVASLQCSPAQLFPCDDFALTISLPADYATTHPYDTIRISTAFPHTPEEDFDVYLLDSGGNAVGAANGPSTENPEVITIPAAGGDVTYTVRIVPTTALGDSTATTISLVAGSAPVIVPFAGLPPRYASFVPPGGAGVGGQGEFNIGYNPATGNFMTFNSATVYRVTPPEKQAPALPESCDATWTDVTPLVVSTPAGLDPILVTEQGSGRTFASNFTGGANLEYAYSDDDGASWIQAGIAAPALSADHETIGTGPYPAGSPLATLAQANGVDYATYYCAQTEAPAFCQRSDDGGRSYAAGIPIYNGVTSSCAAIHGHVRVAPDGTVYVPNKACGSHQGAAVSKDAGLTWSESLVPASTTAPGFDPSVGLGHDSTAYFCYVNGDGHPHVSVSHDDGATWGGDFDIGAAQGIQNAVFVEATAGDANRAACGFVGTTTAGNWQSLSFTGVWYLYIATTYDGGSTWATVPVNPQQPVQGAGGICASGIACSSTPNNRNLLDFNEVTHDEKGRVLFGFDVGCSSDTCLQDPSKNDFNAAMRVARQSGGRTLFASQDPTEPAKPAAACLGGLRDSAGSHLSWKAPDNGGDAIVNYKIYRGTAAGTETLLGQTNSNKISFTDTGANPAVANYFYKVTAVNGQGESVASNELKLPLTVAGPTENICLLPGLTKLTDNAGDNTPPVPGTDLKSFQLTQAYAADGKIKLTFVINTDPGQVPQPVGSSWYVSFKEPDAKVHAVHMTWTAAGAGAPTFESYVAAPDNSGATDGRFVDSATVKPADASSGYDAANGKVTIVVPLADLGLNPGDLVNGFNAAVTQTSDLGGLGAGVTTVIDGMPDSLAYTGSFTVDANSLCAPNSAPMAALSAAPMSGTAPLSVAFDASASADPDAGDSIASYSFDFGDGSPSVTQATATTHHTYNAAGTYPASVHVTDSHGAVSQNATQVVISVGAAGGSSGGSSSSSSSSGGSSSSSSSGGSSSSSSSSGGSSSGSSSSGSSSSGGSSGGGGGGGAIGLGLLSGLGLAALARRGRKRVQP